MEEEEDLKAILIRSIKHSKKVNLVQYYFPLNSEDLFKNQLLIISNKIRKYGNGYLQNKDLVYYYRTFTYQETKITFFCVIYYYYTLGRKLIENLADEIYNITNINNIIVNNNLDNNMISKINSLFYKYRAIIKQEKGINVFISGIELIGDTAYDIDNTNLLDSTHGIIHRRKFNRIRQKDGNKTNSELGSTFNNTPFTETELNFMMRGYNLNNIIKIIKWKKNKKIWLIIFIILSLLLYILLGLYIYIFIGKEN